MRPAEAIRIAVAAAWRRATAVRQGASCGQGIVEYGLILGLSAVVTIVVLVFLGGTLSDVLEAIGRAIDAASRPG
ncbi:MAG: Flp family type IVb pilin [Chloroflexota bacterium]